MFPLFLVAAPPLLQEAWAWSEYRRVPEYGVAPQSINLRGHGRGVDARSWVEVQLGSKVVGSKPNEGSSRSMLFSPGP
eukprot:3093140-Rhodomonas_salina.1